MNAAVAYFYNAKNTFKLTMNASIFEKDGWVAPKRIYGATFNPADGWSNKSKGLVYIHYEDEKGRMKSDLSIMVKHGLRIIATDDSSASEDSPKKQVSPQNCKAPAGRDPQRTQQVDDSSDEEYARPKGARPPSPSPKHACLRIIV